MANFNEKLPRDWGRNSGSDTINLHQFAQHDDQIGFFSGEKFYCLV